MLSTSFTRLLECSRPIQLAPMPSIATVELAAAVSNAGGLGMIGAPLTPPAVLAAMLDDLAARTTQPFGVSFLMPFLDQDCLDVAAQRARLVEFFYGTPDAALVERGRAGGALVGWQVGSAAEAQQAVEAGCDLVVAQGVEAGGHVRGTVGLLPLLEELRGAIDVPVVAAGGIGTGRAMAAALAAGAAAVRIGTRFIAAAESGAHPRYVEALLAARAEDTVLTEAFSVMWPDAPHRVLRASVAAAQDCGDDVIGETPLAGGMFPVRRLSVVCPSRGTTGRVEAMALYAGQSVGSVKRVAPAAEIVGELCDEAVRALAGGSR